MWKRHDMTGPSAIRFTKFQMKVPLQFRREAAEITLPSKKDYIVRVDACGLCRSDLHSASSWARDWADEGHEFGGTVVAVNRDNPRFAIGERVAVRNASACGECASCRTGRLRECRRMIVNKQGYAEYAECDERSLVRASGLASELLALVEPTNVVLDLLHSSGAAHAERILVMGSGTLGLLTAFVAKVHLGKERVLLSGRQPDCPRGRDLGLVHYAPFDALTTATRDHFGGERPDLVLVTSPPSTLGLALNACGAGATIATVGLANEEWLTAEINVMTLVFKRARVLGVFSVPNLYFEEAVDFLRQSGAPLMSLIGQRVTFDELETTFNAWDLAEHFDGKKVLVFDHATPKDAAWAK